MKNSLPTPSRSPPFTARGGKGQDDRAAQADPSGFGTVMEQEKELQAAVSGYAGEDHGVHSQSIDRILREQQVRIGVNITLLEQRYEMLPSPARFHALKHRRRPPMKARHVGGAGVKDGLQDLAGQHLCLLGRIQILVAKSPDGQRGASILAEVARNHEEMAWMLTALLREEESPYDLVPLPIIAAGVSPGPAEANWENEGGAPRSSPAASDHSTGRLD